MCFLYYGSWDAGTVGVMLLVTFIVLEGFGDGAGIIVWAALGDYFGRDRFATLRGYITFSHSWALVASPVYVGWVFDHFGNYDWAIGPAAVCAGSGQHLLPHNPAAAAVDRGRGFGFVS